MAVSISTTHATMRTAASDANAAVDRWSAAYSAIDPETIAKLDAQGLFPVGECGAVAAAFTKKQFEDYGRMIKAAEIK